MALVVASASVAAPTGRAASRSDLIVLTISGRRGEARAVFSSAAELLARLGLRVAASAPSFEPILATVSVDLGASECTVSTALGRGAVLSVRRLAREDSSAVTVEVVAHVIQASVEDLAELEGQSTLEAEGAEGGAPPSSSPPPVDAPLAAATPGEDLGVELGASLSARLVSDVAPPAFGGALEAELRFPVWRRVSPRLALSFAYHAPMTLEAAYVRTSATMLSLRLLALARVPLGAWLALVGGVGGGADLWLTSSQTSLVEGDLERLEASPVLGASVALRLRLSSVVEVALGLAGEVDLQPPSYRSSVDGKKFVHFEPWRVRPALSLGFSFELWGAR